ncbi:MAG: hypothetical protein ACI9O0_000697 [Paracoccaceae bacterium]|jgi:hypothetical protein
MAGNGSTDLVTIEKSGKALAKGAKSNIDPFKLVRDDVHLEDREAVRQFLPDILGRALARVWIDSTFQKSFAEDPKAALERAGVHLPETMSIEFSKIVTDRPKIIVYEKQHNSKFKVRVLYLQLIMLAGK